VYTSKTKSSPKSHRGLPCATAACLNVLLLVATASSRADTFVWQPYCGPWNLDWHTHCDGGWCDPNTYAYVNNWGRGSCYPNYPALPGSGDDVLIGAGGTSWLGGAASIHALVCDGVLDLKYGSILITSVPAVINGHIQYSGGGTQATTLTVMPGAYLDVVSGGLLDGGLLINQGLARKLAGDGLVVRNNAELRNEGTFELHDHNAIVFYDNSTLRNTGVIRRLTDSGVFDIRVAQLDLSGGVEVYTGTLMFTSCQGTSSAALSIDPNCTLSFSGGDVTLLPATTVTGTGVLQIVNPGVVHIQPSLSIANLSAEGGSFEMVGTTTCTTSLFMRLGGLYGTGQTIIAPGASWTVDTGWCDIWRHTVTNHGSATWTGPFINTISSGSVINNTGTIDVPGGCRWGWSDPPTEPRPVVNNSGTFRGSDGASMNGIAFHNTGLVHVPAGVLELDPYTQTAGETRIDAGACLWAVNQTPVQLQGGRLTGRGCVYYGAVQNTGGTVAPGSADSAGTLTFHSGYTQAADGTLEIDLGGTDPGEYDRLVISYAVAYLDGALRLRLIDGFHPIVGQSFVVLTAFYGTAGQFTSVTGPGRYTASYPGTEVIVTVLNGPGDLNCDGAVDFDDINPFVLALSDPAGYAQQYPNCDILTGDCDADGDVDFDDINPFVALLSG
jgi:hypothetical protein